MLRLKNKATKCKLDTITKISDAVVNYAVPSFPEGGRVIRAQNEAY